MLHSPLLVRYGATGMTVIVLLKQTCICPFSVGALLVNSPSLEPKLAMLYWAVRAVCWG